MPELIPGIFNYCDRWCERCNYADRCRLFQSETERNIQHILNDEDPNDPEIIAKDIAESLEDSLAMLKAQMEIEGITEEDLKNFEEQDDDDSKYFVDDFDDEKSEVTESGKIIKTQPPLVSQSDDFHKEVISFFRKMKPDIPDDADESELEKDPLYNELKVLLWYSPQIAVKMRMCFGSQAKIENEKNKDGDELEFETEMMNINSRIAFTGMEKCIVSLQQIYGQEIENHDEVLPLLVLIKKIKDEFEKEFPAVNNFKRPYFD